MTLTRRELLAACAGAAPAIALARAGAPATAPGKKVALGIIQHSYGVRLAADRAGFGDPIAFVEYCGSIGSGGVQYSIGARDPAYAARLREKVEAAGMYIEGSIALPRDGGDRDRFEAEVRTAKEAGATVLRTVALVGRRYETFDTDAAFREFADRSFRSLTLAEPIVARHDMKLAIENHKDWRVDELVAILKRLDSRHVGVNVDTGNNIALLDDPMEAVEALAPWAFSTHIKDMGVEPYPDGFLLSEVPLGEGFLDLKRIIGVLRSARPEIRLNLEMMTRDPLKIPCLAPKYWATFEKLPGRDLARTLAMVRDRASKTPLPRVANLSRDEKIRAEDDNVRRCLAYARDHLGL